MMILTLNQYLLPIMVLGFTGLIFGVLISVLSKVFYVKEDTRVETVTSMLPGYNCGACGHAGCNDMAKSIINDGTPVSNCKPIKPDQIQVIKDFLKQQEEAK